MPYELVDTISGLRRTVQTLRHYAILAVDTESNSLYAYTEQVCLIQLSTPDRDYLVDPLALDSLDPLGELFSDPTIEKVFHAAEYDLIVLNRNFGFQVSPVFDTMWAARIVGWPQCGLAALLQEHFNVTQDKRMQRFNWGKRPLPVKALHYAVRDTHYLLRLRDILAAELQRLHRWEEAQEIFAEIHQVIGRARTLEDYDFWRVKGVRQLNPIERGVLRALFQFREQEARRRNQPRFRIMSDKLLLSLAQQQPTNIQDLAKLEHMPRSVPNRYGPQLVRAIQEGLQHAVELPPHTDNGRRDSLTESRFEALRTWRKQVARKRGVDPDVIISNAVLHKIALRGPRSMKELAQMNALGPWRLQTYGPSLIHAIRSSHRG